MEIVIDEQSQLWDGCQRAVTLLFLFGAVNDVNDGGGVEEWNYEMEVAVREFLKGEEGSFAAIVFLFHFINLKI